MANVKRIKSEISEFQNNQHRNISIGIIDKSNIFDCFAIITGPVNSPYEGGLFFLSVNFPREYPFKPPEIRFLTKVYHPNINHQGGFCLDLWRDKWTPRSKISDVLLRIYDLFVKPNPDCPLVPDITNIFKNDIELYNQIAIIQTAKFAK